MALANAAEKGDWVDVRRLLLAGPGLSLPLVRVSRIDILNVVLGLVEHRSEGHCQRGGNTSTAISTHYWSPATCPFTLLVGHSPLTPPPGIDVGTVLWGFSWPAREGAPPHCPTPRRRRPRGRRCWLVAQCPFWRSSVAAKAMANRRAGPEATRSS